MMEPESATLTTATAETENMSAAGESSEASPPKQETPTPTISSPPTTKKVATVPPGATPTQKASHTLEDAQNDLSNLLKSGAVVQEDAASILAVLKDHAALKEKVDKLKSLLGRSAKAQRESKIDLEATQKRLNQALREIDRLNQKLEKLQSRPTHMDLLMDFETNFDKALLSVGQTGGQDTAATPAVPSQVEHESTIDSMLMQELGEAKTRIDKLESLNSTMASRSVQLESSSKVLQKERDDALEQITRLQMEVKMAQLEAESATRAMKDKAASLEEMQLEIEMVTKASAKAQVRAAQGEKAASSLKTDREHIQQLEAQVQALQEWALASAESKRLMQERVKILETKLKHSQGRPMEGDSTEKILFSRKSSLVVGAGDVGLTVVELGEYACEHDTRFVLLRWKFDFSPVELDVDFNILKGKCETSAAQAKAEYLIKDRTIKGGAGGDTEGCFSLDNACTLLWSNRRSWIRPRTVKYSVDIVALK